MATSTKFPSTNTVVTTGWTSPTNAYADDGSYATAAPAKNATVNSDFGGFGFGIPSGATINSVTIEYQYKVSTTSSVATGHLQGKVGSTLLTDHTDALEPTSDTIRTYTITSERSWVYTDLADGTFFVRCGGQRGSSNTAVTFSLDYIKATVDYTAATTYTGSGTAALTISEGGSGSYSRSYAGSGTASLAITEGGSGSYSGAVVYSGSRTVTFTVAESGSGSYARSYVGSGTASLVEAPSGLGAYLRSYIGSAIRTIAVLLGGSGSYSGQQGDGSYDDDKCKKKVSQTPQQHSFF